MHVLARFAEPVHGYYGPTMGFAVSEFADDPGIMIENTTVHPIDHGRRAARPGAEHAARMAQLPFLAKSLVLVHDRTRGVAAADGSIRYRHVAGDLERLRTGMRQAARAYLAAGAREVWLPLHGTTPVRSESDLAALDGLPLDPTRFTLFYAVHLFGGATMGRFGPCDESGRCGGIRGLYVTDAAVLPSNTGVNPQVTIMANALRIAAGIVALRGHG